MKSARLIGAGIIISSLILSFYFITHIPAFAAVGDVRIAGSFATYSGTLRATQFLDNSNTAFFIDPNATGTSLAVAGSIDFDGKMLEDGVEIFSGVIAAFAGSCPTGWTEYTAAQGRYVVGNPSGGTVTTTAGTALTNGENRASGQHLHSVDPPSTTVSITDSGHVHGPGSAGSLGFLNSTGNGPKILSNSPLTAGDYSNTTANATTGITASENISAFDSANTGTTVGTNAPYIQLRYCQKSAGSDLAEWTSASEKISSGTIVSIDSKNNEKIISSKKPYDESVVGIISTKPGWTIGDQHTQSVLLALSGRVPTKVSLANGEIKRGDPITTSSIPGVGMKATAAGSIVGKAMEPLNNQSLLIDCVEPNTGKTYKCGMIAVFVNVSWFAPENNIAQLIGAFAETGILEAKKLILDGIDVAAKLKELSDRIDTQQQTIDILTARIQQLEKK